MLNIVNQTKSIPISWRYTHALNCVFPQGTLWQLWSQEMPWALGSVQLLSKPFFWRVWGPEWNLVYEWREPDVIPRKQILRPLCQWNWWACYLSGKIYKTPVRIKLLCRGSNIIRWLFQHFQSLKGREEFTLSVKSFRWLFSISFWENRNWWKNFLLADKSFLGVNLRESLFRVILAHAYHFKRY